MKRFNPLVPPQVAGGVEFGGRVDETRSAIEECRQPVRDERLSTCERLSDVRQDGDGIERGDRAERITGKTSQPVGGTAKLIPVVIERTRSEAARRSVGAKSQTTTSARVGSISARQAWTSEGTFSGSP